MTARRLSASGASLAIHLLLLALVIWLPFDAAMPVASGSAASARTATAVHPWERRIPNTEQAAEPAEDTDALPEMDDGDALDVQIPGFTLDVRKIAARATSLFPFLTSTIELRRVMHDTARQDAGFLASPFAPRQHRPGSRPLVLADDALQRIVDSAWSRRHRWDAFRAIARMADRHDPNTGRLPEVLRAYLDQNVLQPYVDTTIRDPRLWTMLGIAADNADFVDFITAYDAEHPSSKAATELLFLLDELAQGNLDALTALLDSDPFRDLWWTRRESPKAFDLVVSLRRRYVAEVQRRGLSEIETLRVHFDHVRLGVLAHILRSTPGGYRSSDARFLIGTVYWKQGRKHEAFGTWRGMTVDPTDSYVGAYSELLAVIGNSGDPTGPLVSVRVDGILASENRRWAEFSKTRLRQFGYAFDTF